MNLSPSLPSLQDEGGEQAYFKLIVLKMLLLNASQLLCKLCKVYMFCFVFFFLGGGGTHKIYHGISLKLYYAKQIN